MRYLRYLALLTALMVPVAYSQAQVRVGIGIGGVGVAVGPGYVTGPPVCAYGYYEYYPYACAPYGYYGPDWFVNGVFIGAGPWFDSGWHRGWDRDRNWYGRTGWGEHRARAYGQVGYARGGFDRGGYDGGYRRHVDGGFRGGQAYRGDSELHGGGFHNGRRR